MTVFFVIASGPSLVREDVEATRGFGKTIVVNLAALWAPWAEYWYSADSAFWNVYRNHPDYPDVANLMRTFTGQMLTTDSKASGPKVRYIPREPGEGLGRKRIRSGANSGYQAMNLAFLRGAKQIVMLGFDMERPLSGPVHFHADHPKPLTNFSQGMPELCLPEFPRLASDLVAEGVRVVNCSRYSAITCFPRRPLQDVLRELNPALPVESSAQAGV